MPRGSRNTPEHIKHRERDGYPFGNLEDMYMSGKSVKPIHIAEWEEESEAGLRNRIIRGEKVVGLSPAIASRYREKTFTFPTGIVQELIFKEGNGGMYRSLNLENYIFMLEGEGTIELNGQVFEIKQGDAAQCCGGAVLRGGGDSRVIAWTVSDPTTVITHTDQRLSNLTIKRRSESKVNESAQWDIDGERYVATDPDDRSRAPDDAIRLKTAVLDFGSNVVGVVTSYKGGPTYEAASKNDNYLYIVSGSYRYFQDDVEFEARPGDVIREISGHYHHWIRHEDSSFLVSSSLPLPKLTT